MRHFSDNDLNSNVTVAMHGVEYRGDMVKRRFGGFDYQMICNLYDLRIQIGFRMENLTVGKAEMTSFKVGSLFMN